MSDGNFIRRTEKFFERRQFHSADGKIFLAAAISFGGRENFLSDGKSIRRAEIFLSVTDVTDKIFQA